MSSEPLRIACAVFVFKIANRSKLTNCELALLYRVFVLRIGWETIDFVFVNSGRFDPSREKLPVFSSATAIEIRKVICLIIRHILYMN